MTWTITLSTPTLCATAIERVVVGAATSMRGGRAKNPDCGRATAKPRCSTARSAATCANTAGTSAANSASIITTAAPGGGSGGGAIGWVTALALGVLC